MRCVFSPLAELDLEEICDYIHGLLEPAFYLRILP